MRVNVEDDLFTERRLAKLARFLKIPEHQALGLLVLFWRSTQSQEIIRAPRERLETLAAMEVDADPSQWIDAMLAAQLASIDGAEIVIRGNAPHVERIIKPSLLPSPISLLLIQIQIPIRDPSQSSSN